MQKLNEKCKEREAAEKANGRGSSEIDGQNANSRDDDSRGCGFSRQFCRLKREKRGIFLSLFLKQAVSACL